MPVIVQNDNGNVVGANSYIDAAFFASYFLARAIDTSDYDTDVVDGALVQATDYLDQRFRYVGRKLGGRDQNTQWPRVNARDRGNYSVFGIPEEVKEAAAEYALRSVTGELNPDPLKDDTGRVVKSKSEKLGPITETTAYQEAGLFELPKYPVADRKLKSAGLVMQSGEVRRG